MKCELVDLIECEQHINDRMRTSPPPRIPSEFLPEAAQEHPMLWVQLPASEVEIFRDHNRESDSPLSVFRFEERGNVVYFPIHPLQIDRYHGHNIIESGRMKIIASYRTVLYEPDSTGPIRLNLRSGEKLMVKLHYDGSLPGIPGDRSLTRNKVAKCIAVSRELERLSTTNRLSPNLKIIREEIGLVHENRGAIFRRIPGRPLIPGFSLHSTDRRFPHKDPLVLRLLKSVHGFSSNEAAEMFGELFATPLLTSLFSAFREGFSLEMHPQNVLIGFNESGLIDEVYYRDLEGVVFSNYWRRSVGLPKLFDDNDNPELHMFDKRIRRYFNRNLDHDLGRFWMNLIDVLRNVDYFQPKDVRTAVHSVRRAVRSAIRAFGLGRLAFWGRLLRFAPSPYGHWYSPGHYLRCYFR